MSEKFLVIVSAEQELVRAKCMHCPWLQAEIEVATILDIFTSGRKSINTAVHLSQIFPSQIPSQISSPVIGRCG